MAVFNFREQQRRARRNTALLVLLFLAMVTLISLVIGYLAATLLAQPDDLPATLMPDPQLMVAAAGMVMAGIIIVALVKSAIIGGDGARVARSLGAEEVTADTQNPYRKRYLNVVEEMAIAAGLPKPRAFVIMHEKGINAFAAGSSPEKAAIGVTHGALAKLSREELEGVVAHEMAHIGNFDTRLNTRLLSMVFGLVVLYTLGRVMLRNSLFLGGRDNKAKSAAVSRRREYLADATGVQFTRNPSGLAGALKKIAATSSGSQIDNAHAEETRHMFFAGATGSFLGLLATHPPLFKRIRALDPQFDPARDPVMNRDEKTMMRQNRAELVGPWG